MTDDEDVMRNVQREKKLNFDLAFFDFHKIISYGTISKGNQWKINGNQRKYWKLLKIQKYQSRLKKDPSENLYHVFFFKKKTWARMREKSMHRVHLRPRIDRIWTPNLCWGLSYVAEVRETPNSRGERSLCVQGAVERHLSEARTAWRSDGSHGA